VASVVRHLVPGLSGDDDAIHFNSGDPHIATLIEAILARVGAASNDLELPDTGDDLNAIVSEWGRRSHEARTASGRLRYWEKKAPFGKTLPHLMYSAEEGAAAGSLAWPTPNTMREVEPSTAFVLKAIPPRKQGE